MAAATAVSSAAAIADQSPDPEGPLPLMDLARVPEAERQHIGELLEAEVRLLAESGRRSVASTTTSFPTTAVVEP